MIDRIPVPRKHSSVEALHQLIDDINDDSVEEPNLHHVLEFKSTLDQEWRDQNHGTSFLFFPCTTCFVQKAQTQEGENIRNKIVNQLSAILIHYLKEHQVKDIEIQTAFFYHGVDGFNNGEIYCWLRNQNLPDELTVAILLEVKQHLKKEPIVVLFQGEKYQIKFYGYGFRQL